MPSIGDTRTIPVVKKCDNGTGVTCRQTQRWERALSNFFVADWVDVGEPDCPACPSGPQPRSSTVILCCFAGTSLSVLRNATGPGPVGRAADIGNAATNGGVSAVFGAGPGPIAGFRPLRQCQAVKGTEIGLWIAALEKARDDLRAQARVNDAQQNDKAIECLKKIGKDFGWFGQATRVVVPNTTDDPQVQRPLTPGTPTIPTRPG